jgi:hypothetical protein
MVKKLRKLIGSVLPYEAVVRGQLGFLLADLVWLLRFPPRIKRRLRRLDRRMQEADLVMEDPAFARLFVYPLEDRGKGGEGEAAHKQAGRGGGQ